MKLQALLPILVGEYEPLTLKKAEDTIRRAIEINPHFADNYVLLGYIVFQQTKLYQAESNFAFAEELGTNDPWLHLNWAALHKARGERAEAENRWRRVLQSETDNINAKTTAYSYLTDSYILAGEHDKAEEMYKEQIKFRPSNAWIRGHYARYLSEKLGRHDEAISQARAALDVMDYGSGHYILAMALYRKWADIVEQSDIDGAEKYFREARENYSQLNKVMAYG